MEAPEVVQKIQYMVAPAIMVSSSALLLLGFHSKFSNLASRFRVLNQEKRGLSQKGRKEEAEEARFKNLKQQIDQLMRRASLVKNSILSTYVAIICFVGTSILIFLDVYASFRLNYWVTAVFFAGFLALIITSTLMFMETVLFFRVIALEKKL